MLVQPITSINVNSSYSKLKKNTNFRGVEELDPYMNYKGPKPSPTEELKYQLSVEAVYYEGKGDFVKAAEIAVEELKFGDSISTKGDYKKQLALTYVRRGLEEVSK